MAKFDIPGERNVKVQVPFCRVLGIADRPREGGSQKSGSGEGERGKGKGACSLIYKCLGIGERRSLAGLGAILCCRFLLNHQLSVETPLNKQVSPKV
jgi:hypothetical protein